MAVTCHTRIYRPFRNLRRELRRVSNLTSSHEFEIGHLSKFKDGAYDCYCAYVLRISRYSDFLSVKLTNTGIFLRGLKLTGGSRS